MESKISRHIFDNMVYSNNFIMKGGDLLSEGGYGCVFYPSINCSGKIAGDYKIVSKVQVSDKNAENEIEIGNIIKNIYDFINYFSPIIESCPIKVKKIKDKQINKCNIFKQYKNSKFKLMKMVYIKGTTFTNYIMNFENKNELIINIINSYNHLLKSLAKLIKVKVVHFDLKGNNILFNSEMKVPIIIDFGLSIPMEKIDKHGLELLKRYFYIYAPEYYIWPIEVHYLNYILHVKDNPSESELLSICSKYTKSNDILKNVFSADFLVSYSESCFRQLKKYNKMSYKNRISYILNAWETWDNYALSMLYLKIFLFININGFRENLFIVHFSKLLLKNIHANPNRRSDLTQNIHNFNKFFYSKNYDKETFENIEKVYEENINYIVKALSQDNDAQQTTLIKKHKA